jgi:hypothetical protein
MTRILRISIQSCLCGGHVSDCILEGPHGSRRWYISFVRQPSPLFTFYTGRKYRDEILKPGGSRDEMDSLKVNHTCLMPQLISHVIPDAQAFLGRAPNSEAFLKHILGSASKSTEPKL